MHFGESPSGSFQDDNNLSGGSADAEVQRASGRLTRLSIDLNAEERVGDRMWALRAAAAAAFEKKVRLLEGILHTPPFTPLGVRSSALHVDSNHLSSLKTSTIFIHFILKFTIDR